ncbi:hypothetical protein RGI145_12415 [Roseomonas gilardii]|uniref:Uncharacterized protein n=1 Tax=Roseomonas gilardii TaxID=257708 RepID=A0A1L7AG73_9PROT|nr:hypothetical protein [Roseomonas gilardii]APT57796.1 hypothetical protein RGI145_12415 [Roseomonas gilardii]
MSEKKTLTAQQAYEAQATAVMLTMAAVIHAIEEAGAVRPGAIATLLRTKQPHHPDPAAQDFARRIVTALAHSLDLSSSTGGQA